MMDATATAEATMLTAGDLVGPKACDPKGHPILIVMPDRFDTVDPRAGHDAVLAPWPDVLAGAFMQTYLHCNYPTTSIVRVKADEVEAQFLETYNILVVGGPVSNSFASRLLDKERVFGDRRFTFLVDAATNIHRLLDKETGQVYDSEKERKEQGRNLAYGIVLKRPSPWNKKLYVIVAAGDYTRGTQGSVAAGRNPQVHRLLKENGEIDRFDMLVRAFYPDATNPQISGEYVFPAYLAEKHLTFSNPDMTRLIPELTNVPLAFEHAKSLGNLLVGISLGWLFTCAMHRDSIFLPAVALFAAALMSMTSRLFKCVWIRAIGA